MNSKSTWFWVAVAAVLMAAILARQRLHPAEPGRADRLLPRLKAADVTSVQVRLRGHLSGICAQLTNGVWQLTQPRLGRARASAIEGLLGALGELRPVTSISPRERRGRPKADQEFGLVRPNAATTLTIEQGAYRVSLDIGTNTPAGDELFVQVVSDPGVYVVQATLLKWIPATQNDWRDTTFLDLKAVAFDRISVTNAGKVLELQHESSNHLWRITMPAIGALANTLRVQALLAGLQTLVITQFVSDEPSLDLEAYGLLRPELELAFAKGTNRTILAQFGKFPTNDPSLVYARHWGQNSVVAISTNLLAPWRDPVSAFRNTNLVDVSHPVTAIRVRGEDSFTIRREGSNTWWVMPQDSQPIGAGGKAAKEPQPKAGRESSGFEADPDAVQELLSELGALPILEYEDALTDLDKAVYGFTNPPPRQYVLFGSPGHSRGATNPIMTQLDFGAAKEDKIHVRIIRPEETAFYTVKLADFQRLPRASCQLRRRHIWSYTEADILRVIVRDQNTVRELVHNGGEAKDWTVAPGSGGMIEPLAVGETVRLLAQLTVTNWVARGAEHLGRFGFGSPGRQITLEVKNGDKPTLLISNPGPERATYGAVTLDQALWIFEFPSWLAEWIQTFLFPPL